MPDKDTTILVTGGTGLVGSHLLRQLLNKGYHRIRAVRRKDSSMQLVADIQDQIEWVEGDILDIFFLDDVMEDIQQVYHAAAIVSSHPGEEDLMRKVNVEGTANVVNAALKAGVDKFLHVSSIAAIGRRKDKEQISEKSKWERNPLNSSYAISKYLAEQEAWRGMAEGLNMAIINPAIVLGQGIWGKGSSQFFTKVWDGLRFYPVGGSAFVDANDVASMSVSLMESPLKNRRFIASAVNKSYKELFSDIARRLDRQPPSVRVAPWLAQTVANVLSFPTQLLGVKTPLPRDIAKLTSHTFYYDNERSRDELNFEYTPIDQTLERICKAFQLDHSSP
ncbi:MAG: NAD-dependent epimerase/dehydratase family protein [Bacteroidota bacterium]